MNKKLVLKILIAVILAVGITVALINPEVRAFVVHPHRLRRYISHFHDFAPFVFIGLYVARTFLLVFPAGAFTIASGALFGRTSGFIFAFVLSMIGAFLSASLSFWLGKSLMADFVQKRLSDRIKFLKEGKIGHLRLVFYLRFIMIMPFDILGYASGAANIKYKDFIIGTILGIIPEFLGYTYLGYTGARKDISLEEKVLISLSLLSLIVLVHFGKKAFEKLLGKRHNESNKEDQ